MSALPNRVFSSPPESLRLAGLNEQRQTLTSTAQPASNLSATAFVKTKQADELSETLLLRRRECEVSELGRSSPQLRSDIGTQSTGLPSHQVASQLLAEWHGQVVTVMDDAFTAQLRGAYGQGVAGKEDEAVIPIEDVRESDLELLEPGAFFRLCISYETAAQRPKRRFTEVVFRRMPAYRREDLEDARERGQEIARGLRLE